jgi:predicted dehydrogenase
MSGVRLREREFRGRLYPTEAGDNTLMVLDFGNSLFALAYGTAAPSIVTAEHACHVIEIVEAAYRAAETGQTQELTTAFSEQGASV